LIQIGDGCLFGVPVEKMEQDQAATIQIERIRNLYL